MCVRCLIELSYRYASLLNCTLELSRPHSLGIMKGTSATAAASMSLLCCDWGAVAVMVMMRTSWPRRAEMLIFRVLAL